MFFCMWNSYIFLITLAQLQGSARTPLGPICMTAYMSLYYLVMKKGLKRKCVSYLMRVGTECGKRATPVSYTEEKFSFMFLKSLMFVCYDFTNIKLSFSVSYMGEIGGSPFTSPCPFTLLYPTYLDY